MAQGCRLRETPGRVAVVALWKCRGTNPGSPKTISAGSVTGRQGDGGKLQTGMTGVQELEAKRFPAQLGIQPCAVDSGGVSGRWERGFSGAPQPGSVTTSRMGGRHGKGTAGPGLQHRCCLGWSGTGSQRAAGLPPPQYHGRGQMWKP